MTVALRGLAACAPGQTIGPDGSCAFAGSNPGASSLLNASGEYSESGNVCEAIQSGAITLTHGAIGLPAATQNQMSNCANQGYTTPSAPVAAPAPAPTPAYSAPAFQFPTTPTAAEISGPADIPGGFKFGSGGTATQSHTTAPAQRRQTSRGHGRGMGAVTPAPDAAKYQAAIGLYVGAAAAALLLPGIGKILALPLLYLGYQEQQAGNTLCIQNGGMFC